MKFPCPVRKIFSVLLGNEQTAEYNWRAKLGLTLWTKNLYCARIYPYLVVSQYTSRMQGMKWSAKMRGG